METLHFLYYRTKLSTEEFSSLVGPIFQGSTLTVLRQLYQWLEIDPSDINEAKYLLLKRFSEVR